MTDTEEKNGDGEKERGDGGGFRIYPFMDLRKLRKFYLKNSQGMIEVDSSDNPVPDKAEDDFGLKRASAGEALDFYRKSTACPDDDADELSEFLDDDQ